MASGKVTRVTREVALCAAPASTAGFDPATEHTVLGGLVVLFVSAAIWMFRRWPSRPGSEAPVASERAPSSREPAAEGL
ncbi:MAG: hypothetical protein H0U12_00550, partial [Thermoleophilaceae bacterium]|nr:hypothetical protein [Thermoleophilaceae bacterium]